MQVELVSVGFGTESGVGIERYSWELMNRLRARGIGVRTVSSNPPRRRYALAMYGLSKVPLATFRGLAGSAIVHATDPSSAIALPFTGRSSVVTFHDIMPLLLADQYGRGDRMFSRAVYRLSGGCDAIIAVSEQTRDEMIRYLEVPREKIRVVPHGVSEDFTVLSKVPKEKETIGYVGDINPRKRLDFLLEGFALLRRERPNARLVLVGANVADYLSAEQTRLGRLVAKLGIETSVTFAGRVTERRLVEFYNHMSVLAIPSVYEGFGLPILEAERCGTPALVREGVRIPKEVSSACLKAETPEEMAQTILNLLADDKMYRKRVEAGLEHSARFSWDNCVNGTIGVYNQLLGRN